MFGRSDALYGVLEKLVDCGHEVTSIATAKEASEYTRKVEDFEKFAAEKGIPFSRGVKLDRLAGFLSAGKPEIGVSINYPVVVTSEVLSSFPQGVLNVHGGDLPRYRGNACQAWAIINGEEKIGLCVHKMEADRLDTGDIITRDYLPIDVTTSITAVHEWILQRSPALVAEALTLLESDTNFVLQRQKDSDEVPLRCFPRRPEDARINWAKDSLEVVRLVKASSRPYRGAFCFFGEDELIVWDATIENSFGDFLAVPGQIMSISEHAIIVACGNGALRITEWQLVGDEALMTPFVQSIRQRLS